MSEDLIISASHLRQSLYPLGVLSSLFFAARFCVQWLQSEKQGKSVTTKAFWQLSSLGNLLLMFHSLFQSQLPVAFVQAGHLVISQRNLNLMKTSPASFTKVLWWFFLSILFVFVWFLLQAEALNDWTLMSIPITPWRPNEVSDAWHLVGLVGILLFASRFWVQWILAEKRHESALGPTFWWLSVTGALLSSIYFFHIGDVANLIPTLFGLIPYLRNLMLQKPKVQEVACLPPR